jgi:hypothetical protein
MVGRLTKKEKTLPRAERLLNELSLPHEVAGEKSVFSRLYRPDFRHQENVIKLKQYISDNIVKYARNPNLLPVVPEILEILRQKKNEIAPFKDEIFDYFILEPTNNILKVVSVMFEDEFDDFLLKAMKYRQENRPSDLHEIHAQFMQILSKKPDIKQLLNYIKGVGQHDFFRKNWKTIPNQMANIPELTEIIEQLLNKATNEEMVVALENIFSGTAIKTIEKNILNYALHTKVVKSVLTDANTPIRPIEHE